MVLGDVGVMGHGVYLGVAAPAVHSALLFAEQRQNFFRSRGLGRGVHIGDRELMKLYHRGMAPGAQYGSGEKLIYPVADMRQTQHTDFVYVLFGHLRVKIIHHFLSKTKGR